MTTVTPPPRKLKAPKAPRRHKKHTGILHPDEDVVVTLANSLLPTEQPVVLTPRPEQVVVLRAEDDEVTIRNLTQSVVPYLLVVVPTSAVKLAMVDWKHVAVETRRGLLAIPWLKRLLSRK